jgi:biopolymer transport protein ExbD
MAAVPAKLQHAHDPELLQRERLAQRRADRKARRRAREAAGEIKELNITAMMDMMTIILVFLLKSYSASSIAVNLSDDLSIPRSTTAVVPQDNVTVTISLAEVAVNDRAVLRAERGLLPASAKEGGDGYLLPAVRDALAREVEKQKYIARYNPAAPFSGRVNVVADKRVPYRTLMEVLYTAGQAELGEYKFMVMKEE